MAKTKMAGYATGMAVPKLSPVDIADLVFEDSGSVSKRSVRGKHISISAIHIYPGKIEADYEVNTGRVNSTGKLSMRTTRNDEGMTQIIDRLGEYVLSTFKELEKA